jgi:hypothetical protein
MERRDMPAASAFDLVRPFLVVALGAFLAGFAGYLALVRPQTAEASNRAQPVSGYVSGAWNLPKAI